MTVPSPDQLKGVLKHMFDENEFLSPYGIRSLSKFHKDNQYKIEVNNGYTVYCILIILHNIPFTCVIIAQRPCNHGVLYPRREWQPFVWW